MINVGIVGATGYTGIELIRLLLKHNNANLHVLTSDSEAGRVVSDVFPSLRGELELVFSSHATTALTECDVVFYATPHATAMKTVPELYKSGIKIIDLSGDFRIKDAAIWAKWYGVEHACPDLLAEAVYGLPEINRADIRQAQLIANPGCYPTAISLALIPAIEANAIDIKDIIADAKSGVSGAGRKASIGNSYSEASENFKAYALSGHRHLPEICQTLNSVAKNHTDLVFTPHLVPMIRGIFASIYTKMIVDVDIQSIYKKRYGSEPFVDILPTGSEPATCSVRGTNQCRIAVHKQNEGGRLILLSVIDNLVKGAAGQAIQNMNILFGLEESTGLLAAALYP